MAGQWAPRILDLKREWGVAGHCLQAEPVKLQGVAAFRHRPSVNSSPGYRGPNCVQ